MKKLILVVMGVFLISVPALATQGHKAGQAGQNRPADCKPGDPRPECKCDPVADGQAAAPKDTNKKARPKSTQGTSDAVEAK